MSQLSAGIVTREIDLTGIIPAVSTTEGAVAGAFSWGPLNKRVLIDSEMELIETFWKPTESNANDWWTVADFLAYTNKVYVVRVAEEDNANTQLRASNATASNALGFLVRNDENYISSYADGSLSTTFGVGEWIAKYPGDLGNSLKVSVCSSSQAYQSTITGNITVSANSVTVDGLGTNFTGELVIGDLLITNTETHKVSSIANTTRLTLATRHVAGASANTGVRRWEFYNEVDVSPGTSEGVFALGGTNDEMHVVVVDEDGLWTKQKNTVLEVYQLVSKASDAKLPDGTNNYYKEVINRRSKFIRWAGHDGTVTNAGATGADTSFGNSTIPLNYSLIGGRNGVPISNNEKIRGYNLFRSKEDVDISLILGSDITQTVGVHVINNVIEQNNRKDCVLFLSPPKSYVVDNEGNEAEAIVAYRNTLPSTSYATLDCNWKYRYDVHNDLYRYTPINGDVAGLYARTDYERDPWWAAAGLNRGQIKNVINLAWNPRLADRDILYKNGINPVVTFPGDGTVLWGNKTLLARPSAFDRMNVRRLFIVLEKAIERAAKYLLFEFNDEFTRALFRNMVEPFLRDVQGRRGIYDFKVVCDETNNTPEVIDRNEFVGDIYIKPARTAEFIYLNFIATRTGVSFDEIATRTGVST